MLVGEETRCTPWASGTFKTRLVFRSLLWRVYNLFDEFGGDRDL